MEGICQLGAKSLQRLKTEPASWTAHHQMESGPDIRVEVLWAADKHRYVFFLEDEDDGDDVEVARILMRDGFWYAREGRTAIKCRPFEASFKVPNVYQCLLGSDLNFVVSPAQLAGASYQSNSENSAFFRIPLDVNAREEARSWIARLDSVLAVNPQLRTNIDLMDKLSQAKETFRDGRQVKVHLKHGFFRQSASARFTTQFRDFRWIEEMEKGALDVADQSWLDQSGPPPAGSFKDCVMFAYGPSQPPGETVPTLDGHFLNLQSGELRRLPFAGAVSAPGTFLPGRSRVVISGLPAGGGPSRLHELDLNTGRNRLFGSGQFAKGNLSGAWLSPDGTTVATMEFGGSTNPSAKQLWLIDLKTERATPVGQPFDFVSPAWLPDSKSLVVVMVDEPPGEDRPGIRTLSRIDRNGRVTPLRKGDFPSVLRAKQRILYLDRDELLWYLCELDGSNAELYADGLSGYAFPTLSPDESRIIFMRSRPPLPPEPILFRLGDKEGRPINAPPGFYAKGQWK